MDDIRNERKVTQSQMAKDLGISRQAISKIENGERNPSLDMAYRIATFYNLSVQEVFRLKMENYKTRYRFRRKKCEPASLRLFSKVK